MPGGSLGRYRELFSITHRYPGKQIKIYAKVYKAEHAELLFFRWERCGNFSAAKIALVNAGGLNAYIG